MNNTASWDNINNISGYNKYTSMFIKGFLDISGGDLHLRNNCGLNMEYGDISTNGKLIINGNTFLNSNLYATHDISCGKNFITNSIILTCGSDVSTNIMNKINGIFSTYKNGTVIHPYNFNHGYGRTAFFSNGGVATTNDDIVNNCIYNGGYEFYAGNYSSYLSNSTPPKLLAKITPSPTGTVFYGNVGINFDSTDINTTNKRNPNSNYSLDISGILHMMDTSNNKKIVLSDNSYNESAVTGVNFYGMGVNANWTRYQVPENCTHNFYSGIYLGTINAAVFNVSSDYRIKEDIKPIIYDNNISVDHLHPVKYWNKNTKKEDYGFLAHQVQSVLPSLVSGEKDGEHLQTMNYIGLISILVKEVQLLKERISVLENKQLLS